jgi:hypothetical protein
MATVTKDFRVKAGLVVEGSTATVNGKNIITAGVVDAKGDLIVASADDAVARLGVGTNGQVLTANSSATYGVEWQAPAAVGVFGSSIEFEGSTSNDYETTLAVTDPTADRTITLPDASGTVALTGDIPSTAGMVTETGTQTLTNKTLTTPKINENVDLTATSTELNVLDGITSSTAELNILDGATLSTTELNYVDGVTSSIQTQLDDKSTASKTETLTNKTLTSPKINEDVVMSATATELNILDGATLSTTELNYVDGVTSSIQNQLDAKLALAGGTMTGAIAMGTNKITGLGTPTDSTDAATKAYVDSAAQGIDWKASVKVASNVNVDIATWDPMSQIDGTNINIPNRVLLKNQTDASENGIYTPDTSGNLVRTSDADTGAELTASFAVFVEEGSNADQGYVLTTDGAITVGTTALTFTQFTGLGQVVAGDGLAKTGNTLNVTAGNGITITGDAVTNSGVVSISGTANQISLTALDAFGATTLSLPQDIHSTATPTFTGVTVGSVTLTDALLGTATATAGTSATTIDTFSATTYSAAKYVVQMKKSGNIEVIEILVAVDGSNNVYLTEYANVQSNGELGTTNAVYSGGNVLLQVTAAAADTAVKVSKTYIEA